MLRGESPQQFLQNLAKTNPQLNGLDLSNPSAAAEKLYKEQGQDIGAAKAAISGNVSQILANKSI